SANIRARYEASPRSANAEALRQLADVAGTDDAVNVLCLCLDIAPVCRAKLFHCYGARVRGCPPYPIYYGMMPQAILAPPPPSGSGWS
ncbi:hypothetical protein C3450_25330, partial [Escherichia coli]